MEKMAILVKTVHFWKARRIYNRMSIKAKDLVRALNSKSGIYHLL